MEFIVYRDPTILESSAYMEIGAGKYSGKHWQDGFIFVSDDTFPLLQSIIERHFPEYGHYRMNDVPRESGLAIASDLRIASQALGDTNQKDALELSVLFHGQSRWVERVLVHHREEVQNMLDEVAATLEQAYVANDYSCILGM